MKKLITNFLIFALVITMVQIPGFSVMAETQESKTTIIDYTNFVSALYKRSGSGEAGTTNDPNRTDGTVGAFTGKTNNVRWYKDLFCNVDISTLYGKKIENAILCFYITGTLHNSSNQDIVRVWAAEGDFTPGVTLQEELPERNPVIASGGTSTRFGESNFVSLDVSSYLNNLLSMDADTFSFALGISTGNTSTVANENTSNESYRPYLEVTYTDRLPEVVSYPSSGDEISCNAPVSVEFSNRIDDITVNSASVKLFKGEEEVVLSDEDIEVNSGAIIVSSSKEPDCTYTLKLSSSIKDIYGNSIGELHEYTFNTVFVTSNADISASGNTSSKIKAAVYDINQPDSTGIITPPAGTCLPSLSDDGKVLRDYYLIADISSLSGKNLSSVQLDILVDGTPKLEIYALGDGDFNFETAYKNLPEATKKIALCMHDKSLTGHVQIDISDYVRELLFAGKSSLRIVIKQSMPDYDVSLANEYYDGWKHRPKLVVVAEEDQYIALGTSLPANNAENVATDANIELAIKTADITSSVTADNVVLLNNKTNEVVNLADSDIIYNVPARKLIINPSVNLDKNTSYTLTIKGLMAGNTKQIKDIVISFTTENVAIGAGEIMLDKENGAASVDVRVNDENAKEVMLIIAAYDDSNRMTNVATCYKEILNVGSHTINAELENFSGAYKIKAFLWQGYDEITPIKKAE